MPSFTGLYLGVDFVDMVVLAGAKEPKIIASGRTFLYGENTPPEQKDKNSALAPAIKKALEQIRQNVGLVNFALPQDEIMARCFKMPFLPEEERPTACKFEAQKYLPFKLDDTVSDFTIIEESRPSKTMDVLFVAVNKYVLEKYTAAFKNLGLRLNIVDTAPMALLRVLSYCKQVTAEQTQVVVYLEKAIRASVIIAKDANLYLAREVTVSTSTAAFFENILNNVRLSVDYYKRETREVLVSELILCGDGDLKGLEIYLKENIGTIPLKTFSLTNEIDGLTDLSRKQSIAIGLGLASFERPHPKINLLSRIPKTAVSKGLEEYKPLIVEGLVIVFILAAMQIIGSINLAMARRNAAGLRQQKTEFVKGLRPDVTPEELLYMEGRTKQQIGFLKTLVGENRIYLTKKLSTLGRLLPEGVWIESLEFTDEFDKTKTLNLRGMIYSTRQGESDIANKLLDDMKASQSFSLGFEEIRLSSLERTTAYNQEVLAFLIKCSGKPLDSSGFFTTGDSSHKRGQFPLGTVPQGEYGFKFKI